MTVAKVKPHEALDAYIWLKADGYWDDFSLLEWTRHYWQPMTEQALYWQLVTRTRFHEGSKPCKLAEALVEARENRESWRTAYSLTAALRASQGGQG